MTFCKRIKTSSLSEAVGSLDPFEQRLVGLAVASCTGGAGRKTKAGWREYSRLGEIVAHECYDSDYALCVERITVRWEDGTTERKSPRTWHGAADGESKPAAYLRAVARA